MLKLAMGGLVALSKNVAIGVRGGFLYVAESADDDDITGVALDAFLEASF